MYSCSVIIFSRIQTVGEDVYSACTRLMKLLSCIAKQFTYFAWRTSIAWLKVRLHGHFFLPT